MARELTLLEYIDWRYGGHGRAELDSFMDDVGRVQLANGKKKGRKKHTLSIWGVYKWVNGQRTTPRIEYRRKIDQLAKKDHIRLTW